MKKLKGATCGIPVVQGKYCPDHMCPQPGCNKPKGKKAVFCKTHTAPSDDTHALYAACFHMLQSAGAAVLPFVLRVARG